MINKDIFQAPKDILLKIIFMLAGLIALLWLISALWVNFLNINAIIAQHKDLNIRYSHREVEYFFIPKIIIRDVKTRHGNFSTVRIKFSLWSILTFKPKALNCECIDSVIEINTSADRYLLDYQRLVNYLMLADRDIAINFQNITLETTSEIINFSTLDLYNSATKFLFTANYADFSNISVELFKNPKDPKLNINIQDQESAMQIKQVYSSPNQAKGDLQFIGKHNNTIIKADISMDNNKFSLANITCFGDQVSGNLNMNFSDQNFDLSGHFTHLNFSDLEEDKWLQTLLGLINFDQLLIKNSSLNIAVSMQELNLVKQKISNFNLQVGYNANQKYAVQINGQLDQTGLFNFTGMLNATGYTPLLEGDINLIDNDFNRLIYNLGLYDQIGQKPAPVSLKSTINLGLVDLSLCNLAVNIGNMNFNGKLSVKNISDKTRIVGDLKITNFDTHNPVSIINDGLLYFEKILFQSYKDDYFDQMIPLRTNDFLVNLRIKTDYPYIYKDRYDCVDFILLLTENNLIFESLRVEKNNFKVLGSFSIDVSNFQPIIKLDIKDGQISDLDFGANLLNFKNLLNNTINLQQLTLLTSIQLANLGMGGQDLKNFKTQINSNSNQLIINDVSFELFDGKAELNGIITTNPFLVSLGYAYNNFNLTKMLNNSIILSGAKGFLSTNGVLSFGGDNLDEMLYLLRADGKVLGRGVVINNIAIDDLINKISNNNYNSQNLDKDLQYYANNQSTTVPKFSGSMHIENGKINLNDFIFNTAKSTGAMAGLIDLYKQQIDMQAGFGFSVKSDQYSTAIRRLNLHVFDYLFKPKNALELTK